jgi:RsiG-like
LSDEELKTLIDDLEAHERKVSYERRLLHGKIDILRAELVTRLQRSGGRSILDQVDVERLTDILTGKVNPESAASPGNVAPPPESDPKPEA